MVFGLARPVVGFLAAPALGLAELGLLSVLLDAAGLALGLATPVGRAGLAAAVLAGPSTALAGLFASVKA